MGAGRGRGSSRNWAGLKTELGGAPSESGRRSVGRPYLARCEPDNGLQACSAVPEPGGSPLRGSACTVVASRGCLSHPAAAAAEGRPSRGQSGAPGGRRPVLLFLPGPDGPISSPWARRLPGLSPKALSPTPFPASAGSDPDPDPSPARPLPLSYSLLDGEAALPAVIFLHGLFGCKTNFSSIAKAFSQQTGRRVRFRVGGAWEEAGLGRPASRGPAPHAEHGP